MVIAIVVAIAAPAHADDDYAGASVIYARGGSLYRADPRGKGETELAKLPSDDATGSGGKKPAPVTVRALRTDALGKILLADLGGTWSWLPLDGSTQALAALPCADGPAQLAEDGACVLCRAKSGGSIIVNLATGKTFPVDIPAPGARLAGVGAERKLVWADKAAVWSASPGNPKKPTKVAPDPPLRGFLPSPDGARAVGIYADEVYVDIHHKKPADLLMGFALDGQGARRKAIKDGVPVEWSHDAQWVLVQDGANACIMSATGGEYKCWKGYTAASISSDGKFALVLGNRDGSKRQTPASKKGAPRKPTEETEDTGSDDTTPDVAIAPPSGPLALYRARLEGSAFTESPALVAKIVDGAAVWVPGRP